MLPGSFRGLVCPAPWLAVPATDPWPAPDVAAPDAPAAELRSSTGAPPSCFGVVEHAASASAASTPIRVLFMGSPLSSLRMRVDLFLQRTPRGFAHIARCCGQPLLDATVAGARGQYTTASNFGRIEDQLAVRCDAGRFVETALRQDLDLPR